MDQKLLEEIKRAEKDADRIIETAQKRKSRLVLEMADKAKSLEQGGMETLKKDAEEEIRKFREKTEKERERFLEGKREETEGMKKDAEKNIVKAVEALKKEFCAFIGE
jgi:ATP synthase H subunit